MNGEPEYIAPYTIRAEFSQVFRENAADQGQTIDFDCWRATLIWVGNNAREATINGIEFLSNSTTVTTQVQRQIVLGGYTIDSLPVQLNTRIKLQPPVGASIIVIEEFLDPIAMGK